MRAVLTGLTDVSLPFTSAGWRPTFLAMAWAIWSSSSSSAA
jgi:hypothetical protein